MFNSFTICVILQESLYKSVLNFVQGHVLTESEVDSICSVANIHNHKNRYPDVVPCMLIKPLFCLFTSAKIIRSLCREITMSFLSDDSHRIVLDDMSSSSSPRQVSMVEILNLVLLPLLQRMARQPMQA